MNKVKKDTGKKTKTKKNMIQLIYNQDLTSETAQTASCLVWKYAIQHFMTCLKQTNI